MPEPTAAQAERLAAIEAAPDAPESLRERVARAIWSGAEGARVDWDETNDWWRDTYRRLADAALRVITEAAR